MSKPDPRLIAERYPALATGGVSEASVADALGVTRHTVRVAAQIARESAAYSRGHSDATTAQSEAPVDILVIPDAHVMPGENLRRFSWVGKHAAWRASLAEEAGREFYLLSIGDFNDVHSLSSWDKGKASGENARYHKDCEANRHALTLIDTGLGEYADRVNKVITLGNHENRIERFANDNPAMQGHISAARDLGFLDHGWTVVPFLKPYCINGVHFVHYVQNGAGRAMSGVTLVRRLVQYCHASVVVGHTHKYRHYAERTPLLGKRLHGVEVGCYFEADHDFAGPMGNNQYDKQLLMLHGVRDGDFDLETVRMEELRAAYE